MVTYLETLFFCCFLNEKINKHSRVHQKNFKLIGVLYYSVIKLAQYYNLQKSLLHTVCYPNIAGSNPASSEVVKVEKVVPKIYFFEGRFEFLRSQEFQKYKYHFCCQYFVWAYTGGHCVLWCGAYPHAVPIYHTYVFEYF